MGGSGDRGCGRWLVHAGVAGLALLLLFLLASARFVERGMSRVALRAVERVEECLPFDLKPAQRARLRHNLERFAERVRRGEGGPLVSSFLGRVSAALEDDRLTGAEVDELNRLLEGAGEPPAAPPGPGGSGRDSGP